MFDSLDAFGGFSDRGFGRGPNRGRGRFDPYSRSVAPIGGPAAFAGLGRDGFGKQNDFNSRRAPGYKQLLYIKH